MFIASVVCTVKPVYIIIAATSGLQESGFSREGFCLEVRINCTNTG